MPTLEFLRSEIEHMRSQIGRQRKEILQLQRAAISTASAEALLTRMQAKVEGLCTERDRLTGELMRRRSGIVEHPFGTLKCRAGYRHFLVRGFDKVRGEWGLMALCYNFTRALNILGFDGFLAALKTFAVGRWILAALQQRIQLAPEVLWTNIRPRLAIGQFDRA